MVEGNKKQGVARGFKYHVEAHPKYGELRDTRPGFITFHIANNKDADQTARMHILVCTFAVRVQQSQGFPLC